MLRITCAAFAGLLSLAAQAEGISGDVGAGVSYQPHDPTGSRYETRPVPYLDLDWGNVEPEHRRRAEMERAEHTGFKCRSVYQLLAGAHLQRFAAGHAQCVGHGRGRGFIQYAPADFWRVYAQLGQAVGGGHSQSGALGKVGGELGYPLGGGIIGSSGLVAHFADARQTQTFFGWMITKRRPQASRPTTPVAASRT